MANRIINSINSLQEVGEGKPADSVRLRTPGEEDE